jgi:hypothetical protein
MKFHWNLSYQDQVEYEVYGADIQKVERYNGSAYCLAYMRSWYNGDFERDVLARQGGVAVTVPILARWTEEEYQAFEQFWQEVHERDCINIACLREKYKGYEEFFQPPELQPCPRPIFWDNDGKTWATEAWFLQRTETRKTINDDYRDIPAARKEGEM